MCGAAIRDGRPATLVAPGETPATSEMSRRAERPAMIDPWQLANDRPIGVDAERTRIFEPWLPSRDGPGSARG
jgi:hypothetical protein